MNIREKEARDRAAYEAAGRAREQSQLLARQQDDQRRREREARDQAGLRALERHEAAVKTERARKAEERKVAAERKQALRNRKDQHRRIEKQRREEKTSHPANVPSSMVSLLNNRLITHL